MKVALAFLNTSTESLRRHLAESGTSPLRLKKNIDWNLFKRWKVTRNPSITEEWATFIFRWVKISKVF